MARERGVEALREFRAQVSQAKQQDVLQAVQELSDDPTKMTIAGISRAAKVSREFIHSHPHLHRAVREAALRARRVEAAVIIGTELGGSVHGLRADRSILLSRIERQRIQISEQQTRMKKFEEQRQRWLGSQLTNLKAIDPEVHAELQLTNERLMSDNMALKRKVAEQRQLLDIARADLAAVREGWAADIDQFTKEDQRVVLLDRARRKET